MMSKVMETEYTMHIKGTDLSLKETSKDLLGIFNFILQQPESWQILGKMTKKKKKKANISRGIFFVCFTKALFTCLSLLLLIRKLWFNVKQHQGHIFVQELKARSSSLRSNAFPVYHRGKNIPR